MKIPIAIKLLLCAGAFALVPTFLSLSSRAATDTATSSAVSSSQKTAPSDIDNKVEALLKQMSLDEKIGQMTQVDYLALRDLSDIAKYSVGSVLCGGSSDPADGNSPKSWKKLVDSSEAEALKTKLKIPLLFGIDAVHGHNNVESAVIFPHNIGLGATRNPVLVEQVERACAEEVSATDINWVFAPCIAVVRNPRWGRSYESFGEEPELAELLGSAAVRGFQGKDMADHMSILACSKHFLGDGGTTNGKDQGNTECDEATLRKIFLPGYAAAVKDGVGSIMVSYSSWNGQKMHGNKYLLTDVLKGELGFKGFLISDWAAIDQLSPDYKTDVEHSINAGLDMIMVPYGPTSEQAPEPGKPKNTYVDFITDLKALVQEGKVQESRIDDAVRRILRVKYELGLFDRKPEPQEALARVGSADHRAIARDAVRQSLVLLKNENHALPISKNTKHLAIVGRGANDLGMQCGGWTIDWQGKPGNVTPGGTTILEGIKHVAGPNVDVKYLADGGQEGDLKDADAVIVVLGEMPYAEGKGDRKDLSLSKDDMALVAKAKKSGKPLVTVLLSGRPMILNSALDDSDAFIAAFLPGTEGAGVADVLFGANKPTGKLPITWPKSMDQIPIHSSEPGGDKALFPYGFGLTY